MAHRAKPSACMIDEGRHLGLEPADHSVDARTAERDPFGPESLSGRGDLQHDGIRLDSHRPRQPDLAANLPVTPGGCGHLLAAVPKPTPGVKAVDAGIKSRLVTAGRVR